MEVGDSLGWVTRSVKESIWGFITDLISDILSKAFSLIAELILQTNDIDKYFNYQRYLVVVQSIACALLVLFVVWEATKLQSGGVLPGHEKSFGTLVGQSIVAAALIFFLPWSVTNIFLKINNLVIKVLTDIGVNIDVVNVIAILKLGTDPLALGGLIILMTLVLVIGLLGIGIASGIRFIEIIIIILISPIVAISALNNYDGIQVWVRETIAVVFTQCVQLLSLQLVMVALTNMTGVMSLLLSIGCVVVGLRGPKVLRQFLYSSGTGSALVGAAGAAGRMGAMKFMMKAVK